MSDMIKKTECVRAGVGIMLLRDGKVLLGKRHDDPNKADSELDGEGTWTMPGGKLDFGDKIADGAARELVEETGIEIDPSKLKLHSVTNERTSNAHFVTIGFICKESEGEAKTLEPDEITEWKWFALDDLPDKVFPASFKMLEQYKSGEIYKYS